MHDPRTVVVFIPAYNEEESIAAVIDAVREHCPEHVTEIKGYVVRLLVVDDGSHDRTAEIAAEMGVKVITHHRNLGLGAATRTAMQEARDTDADVAVKLDADLQHLPEDIEKVVTPILQDQADICWGSRFAGAINYRMPLIRRLGNRVFTWLMNKLTGYKISDAQTGLMAFSLKYLQCFEMYGDYNPPQQLLIDANNKHMRYAEVPVVFNPRTTGHSFITLRYPFLALLNILRLLVYGNPLKVFAGIGVAFLLFSIVYFFFTVAVRKLGLQIEWLLMENLTLATLFVGLQCFFFGVLADLIIRKIK